MIDEQKIIGMIPVKAIECLTAEEEEELRTHIDEGFSFPYDELGKFQIVASLLPLSLQLEVPDPQLKDNVALRLIKLAEEIRMKKIKEEEELKAQQEMETPVEEYPVQMEENVEVVSEDISFKVPEETEPFNLDEIQLPEIESLELSTQNNFEGSITEEPVNFVENQNPETIEPDVNIPSFEEISVEQEEITEQSQMVSEEIQVAALTETFETPEPEPFLPAETKPQEENFELKVTDQGKKSVSEKMLRALELDLDSLKSSFNETEKRLTKNLLLAYIAIAILLALLIFVFFKFTSDINKLEKKIEDVRKNSSSELIKQAEINYDFSSLC